MISLLAALAVGTAGTMTATSAGTPAISTPPPGAAGATITTAAGLDFTYYGQSCFLMQTPAGTRVLMDPVAFGIGFDPPVVKADVVTISHEHPDHDNLKMVEVAGAAAGGAEVIHGLTRRGWNDVDEAIADVRVTDVHAFHDADDGKSYGRDAIFVFDVSVGKDKLRVVHLGDLGASLDDAQVAALGTVDVLMLPVGGFDTIDARGARTVVEQLHPRRAIFPMHYRARQSKIRELATVDVFLSLFPQLATHPSGSSYLVGAGAPPKHPPVVVLTPQSGDAP